MADIHAQVHNHFKVFIAPYDTRKGPAELSAQVSQWVAASGAAAKSIGVEYLEATKRLVLTVGPVGLTAQEMDDVHPMIFYGATAMDARKEAAFELFETFWPELYKAWNEDSAGVLRFDWDDFIDSPIRATHEVRDGEQTILMVAPN